MSARTRLLAALALVAGLPAGATIYVDDNCTATQTGTQANPFCTIQDGVDAAVLAGDDAVRVKPGTYRECVFVDGGVNVVADDVDTANRPANSTVIDGNPHAASGFPGCADVFLDRPLPAVDLTSGARLEGFTVRGGADAGVFAYGSVVITRNVIEGSSSGAAGLTGGYGGGIYFFSYTDAYGDVSAEISKNTVRQNTARQGAGISALSGAVAGAASSLVVKENTVSGNTGQESGGGIDVATHSAPAGIASAVITKNVVSGNAVHGVGQYGYGAGIWARTLGYGTETIRIGDEPDCDPAVPPCRTEGNTVTGNTATTGGGGISAWLQASPGSVQDVSLQGNIVTSNVASEGFGGGMELFYRADALGASPDAVMAVERNDIGSNTAAGPGGGISLLADVYRTNMAPSDLVIRRNVLRTNVAGTEGGGAYLELVALGDPAPSPTPALTDAVLTFGNNLVRGNDARTTADAGTGGGVQADLQATGAARAELLLPFDTVVNNKADLGGGGVDVRVFTAVDPGNGLEGSAGVFLENSIVSGNESFGLGGSASPEPGNTVNLEIVARYNVFFQNAAGDFEDTIVGVLTQSNNLFVDPQLNASFVPNRCGPAQDAADPLADFSEEPAFHGGRANLGHTGGTAAALATLPDINGDGRVDGLDVLRIAASFAAIPAAPHYNPAADLDRTPVSGVTVVDGTDLALVTAFYGQACP